jgi:site-specific recombinase XerC
MAIDTVFCPLGPTTLVANTAVTIQKSQGAGSYSYRVRNLSSSQQWFTWGGTSSVASLTPAAGVPAPNTIGMLPTSVETFEITGATVYFIASSSTGFEFTPGQGA